MMLSIAVTTRCRQLFPSFFILLLSVVTIILLDSAYRNHCLAFSFQTTAQNGHLFISSGIRNRRRRYYDYFGGRKSSSFSFNREHDNLLNTLLRGGAQTDPQEPSDDSLSSPNHQIDITNNNLNHHPTIEIGKNVTTTTSVTTVVTRSIHNNKSNNKKVTTLLETVLLSETSTNKRQYNWTEFFPRLLQAPPPRQIQGDRIFPTYDSIPTPTTTTTSRFGRGAQILRWLITGSSPSAKQSDLKTKQNFAALARMLILLRSYEEQYGSLENDNGDELAQLQAQVLADITQDLYSSGTPTWVLEQVMERVAEGLTGKTGVQFMMLPRRCFVYYPPCKSKSKSATIPNSMFRMNPGFDICKLGEVEQVAVRLASFASNTKSSERLIPVAGKMPSRLELETIKSEQQYRFSQERQQSSSSKINKDELAKEILDLASSTYGLFFFLNSPKLQSAVNLTTTATSSTTTQEEEEEEEEEDPFWQVNDSTRELFTRLAAEEASQKLDYMRKHEKVLYSPHIISLFRTLSSAGACAMWFGGSVHDMIISGILANMVAYIGTTSIRQNMAFEERVLTEVVASFIVGLIGGIVSIKWPNKFCFGAIAIASIMELLQGFKVVYAVIEVMSKNIVTGTSRLLEGILFTGLISYGLKYGLDFAFQIMVGGYVTGGVAAAAAAPEYANMLVSAHGISSKFFPLILPFAATAWSGLFRPSYADLPLMTFHGMLAFALNLAGAPMFLAAMCVTFSAGIISRFTGREALGNTLAGLYALVPGTYMVGQLLRPNRVNFLEIVLFAAASIGLGSWTGTILCSPTILGKSSWSIRRQQQETKKKQPTMLYF